MGTAGRSTPIRVLRDPDRGRLAASLVATWAAGLGAWVVDPAATRQRLAALGGGLLDPTTLDTLERSGRATVELDVPTDTATIVTSSGTTGAPKVLALTTPALEASADGAHEHLGLGPGDRWLLALPLHHVAGQGVLWRSRRLGTDPVVQERLDPAAARAAGATVVSLVPTQLRRLVDSGDHLDATVLLGGGAISPRLLADAAAGGHVRRVVRSYGLTETAGGCVYDGLPFRRVEVAAPGGRLRLRGPVLAAGRLDRAGLAPVVDRAGWLVTNDLGAVSPTGAVAVTGRADEVVISGGVKVDPGAVEAVLEDQPDIVRAGVVGLPDPEWGHRVVAAVTTRDGIDPDLAAARTRVRDHLGAAAVPRRVVVLADIPLTPLGKVARDRLRVLLG